MILIENNYFISIIVSLLLLNGFYNLSYKYRYKTDKIISINNFFISTVINFYLIINFLAILTFNLLLFLELNENIIKIISLFVILIGFHKPTYLRNLKKILKEDNNKKKLLFIILFFYFILSLNPITDSDSLDYHLTIPLYQIEFGNPQFYKYWLHSQLVGSGETLLLYSLVFGGLHFSQILQFLSLLFIILIVLNLQIKKIFIDNEKRIFVSLCIISMPALIFLASTSKPQLFPIATNFISLIVSVFYLKNLKKYNLLITYSLIIFLLFSSIQMKFSFLLSSAIITLYSVFQIINKNFIYKSFIVIFILFLIIIVPREIYEFTTFNNDVIYNFFNPVTDLYASEAMNASLRHGSGNSRYYFFWLFAPYNQYGNFSLGEITYCLGPFVLYFLFNYKINKILNRPIITILFIYFIFALNLAQPTGRFYVEIFIWILFFSLFTYKKNVTLLEKLFQKILIFSSILFLVFLGYFSGNLFLGNLSKFNYDKVLSDNADGYLLYKWANQVIPDNSVIISSHRASAFYKYEVIPYEFRLFTDGSNKNNSYYLKSIMEKNPQFILYRESDLNNKRDILKNCRGELFKFKKNVGYDVGRNPFSINKKFYDGYIYRISNKKIQNCIKEE